MKPILNKLNQNKTEAAYDETLRLQQIGGQILDYKFEPFRLILRHSVPGRAKGMTYTPDFLVVYADRFEVHEVKGWWRDDARAKIKMAAEIFPWFEFKAVKKGKGCTWEFEEF